MANRLFAYSSKLQSSATRRPLPDDQTKMRPLPCRPLVTADCRAADACVPGPLSVVPLSVGFHELFRMSMTLGRWPNAAASWESLGGSAVSRKPASDASGATPATPMLLSPRAAATPATAVPCAAVENGCGSLLFSLKSHDADDK